MTLSLMIPPSASATTAETNPNIPAWTHQVLRAADPVRDLGGDREGPTPHVELVRGATRPN
jgi:hypothetical protein